MSVRGDIRKRVIAEWEKDIVEGSAKQMPPDTWIEKYVKTVSESEYRKRKENRWQNNDNNKY